AKAAGAAFAAIAAVLPPGSTIVPRALARFAAGEHEALAAFLDELAAAPGVRTAPALHDVRRMQAAHALLRGQADAAADIMLQDLAWLLEQPSRLADRAGEFAEAGEVLVRLGRGERLRPALATLQLLRPNAAVADAAAFLAGLCDIAATGQPVPAVAAGLER